MGVFFKTTSKKEVNSKKRELIARLQQAPKGGLDMGGMAGGMARMGKWVSGMWGERERDLPDKHKSSTPTLESPTSPEAKSCGFKKYFCL